MTIDREEFERLMTAALDGELTPEERRRFDEALAADAARREEYEDLKKLKEVTSAMKFKSPKTEVWDRYWVDVYNRMERAIGWVLLSMGAVILLTYYLYKVVEEILRDPDLSTVVRVGAIALIAGLAVLLVSVIREKWFTRKNDPYKEVLR